MRFESLARCFNLRLPPFSLSALFILVSSAFFLLLLVIMGRGDRTLAVEAKVKEENVDYEKTGCLKNCTNPINQQKMNEYSTLLTCSQQTTKGLGNGTLQIGRSLLVVGQRDKSRLWRLLMGSDAGSRSAIGQNAHSFGWGTLRDIITAVLNIVFLAPGSGPRRER